jgi:hypothetical protein
MNSLWRHRGQVNETCSRFNEMATRSEFMSLVTTCMAQQVVEMQFQEHQTARQRATNRLWLWLARCKSFGRADRATLARVIEALSDLRRVCITPCARAATFRADWSRREPQPRLAAWARFATPAITRKIVGPHVFAR